MKIIDCPQYSAQWWSVRRGMPTASAFHRIITPTGKESEQAEGYACELIAEEFDAFYGIEPEFVSQDMENGSRMEPEARRFYEWTRDAEVAQVGFCMADSEKYGCSPDALVGSTGCLELKCPKPATQIRYLLDNELPSKYRPQVHGHLVVTGREWVDFMSYVAGFPPFLVRVLPNEYTLKVKAAVEKFCETYAGLKALIMEQREEAILRAIRTKGDQLSDIDRGLVPPVLEESYF